MRTSFSLRTGLVAVAGAACAAGALVAPLSSQAAPPPVRAAVSASVATAAPVTPVLHALKPAAAAKLLRVAGTTPRGAGYQAWTWKDAEGTNVLLTTRQVDQRKDGLIYHGVVRVYQGLGLGTQASRVVQQVAQTNGNCDVDGGINTTLHSTGVTDVDRDGVAEVSVGWWLECRGDVGPANVALAVLEHGNVSVLEGQGSPRKPRRAEREAGVFPPPGEAGIPPVKASLAKGSAPLGEAVLTSATNRFYGLYR